MKISIAMTVGFRLGYLQEVLKSWQQVPRYDTHDWFFRIEPTEMDIIHEVMDFPVRRASKRVWVNESLQGPLTNPYLVLEDAFLDGAQFVILGEDDSTVTPDVLRYFTQLATQLKDDRRVFAVCAFTRQPVGPVDGFFMKDYFASCVWGTWLNRWENHIQHTWDFDYRAKGWDHNFVSMIREQGLYCAFPAVSRAQHIGQYDGAHMIPQDYDVLKAQSVAESFTTVFREVSV